jgi:subtilisin family serine protease
MPREPSTAAAARGADPPYSVGRVRSWFRMLAVAAALLVPAGSASAADFVVSASSPAALARATAAAGGNVIAALPQIGAYLVGAPASSLACLRSAPGIVAAERDGTNRLFGLPIVDPLAFREWYVARVEAGLAWSETLGAPSVRIAVVDTGIDYTSPELAGRVTLGPDFGQSDSDPMDTIGHGTSVASIAAAADDGTGMVGLCPHCSVIAVKVLRDGADTVSKFTTAQGIVWAADHGADIINLSLGGPDDDVAERDAVAYAQSRGALVVAAAGNEGTNVPQFPAGYPGVLAVASATDQERLSVTSSFGDWVDVAAPGTEMLAAGLHGTYGYVSGTSFAAPLAAGVAGLLLSRVPGLDAATLADDIVSGAEPLLFTSLRRVNAARAMRLALGQPVDQEAATSLTFVSFTLDRPPRAGSTITARATVMSSNTGQLVREGDVLCEAYAGQRRLRLAHSHFSSSEAVCRWDIPLTTAGKKLRALFEVVSDGAVAQHRFSTRIRPVRKR